MVTTDEITDLFGATLRRFMHENFQSTEQISEAVNQTAAVSRRLFELLMETGSQADSSAKIYYDYPGFNLKYGTMIFKLSLLSAADIFAFVGVKLNTTDPTADMTESHAGMMFENGNVYFSTADGYNQQKVRIIDVDPTNNIIYKIEYNRMRWKPLPIWYPYFDGFRYEPVFRNWSTGQTNSSYPPENIDHYFVAYIRNTTGENKKLYIRNIVYGEIYAD